MRCEKLTSALGYSIVEPNECKLSIIFDCRMKVTRSLETRVFSMVSKKLNFISRRVENEQKLWILKWNNTGNAMHIIAMLLGGTDDIPSCISSIPWPLITLVLLLDQPELCLYRHQCLNHCKPNAWGTVFLFGIVSDQNRWSLNRLASNLASWLPKKQKRKRQREVSLRPSVGRRKSVLKLHAD